ncbi:MAG: YceI family protein [Flavisolibacter sp.]
MRRLLSIPALLTTLYFISIGVFVSCRHGDQLIEPATFKYTRGDAVMLPGNLTAGNANEWKFDKAHSSVIWQTDYLGAAGLLIGRFTQFGMAKVTPEKALEYAVSGQPLKDMDWAFYESDPSKTFFNGYVQVNTSNTGEPGRDNGCNITTLGTVAMKSGVQNLTTTNLAKIETTKIELDPNGPGYLVTLNFTFKGGLTEPKTISLPGKLTYVPRKTISSSTGSGYDVFGLQLKFQFNCRDFNINSTNVADKIEIECNANFNNK